VGFIFLFWERRSLCRRKLWIPNNYAIINTLNEKEINGPFNAAKNEYYLGRVYCGEGKCISYT
jgi:hypothetical protein